MDEGTNEKILELLARDKVTSASVMMPAPYAKEAIEASRRLGLKQVGIHLTLTSDARQTYRPVVAALSRSCSFTTDEGTFFREVAAFELRADPDEVAYELEAQILLAIELGLDPTHLDCHAGSLLGLSTGRDLLDVVFEASLKFGLPFNLPVGIIDQDFLSEEQRARFRSIFEVAVSRGLIFIDDIIALPYCMGREIDYRDARDRVLEMIRRLRPGVTQWTVHPSKLTDRLKGLTDCYRERELEARLVQDDAIRDALREEGIRLLSWGAIRDKQREQSHR